MIEALEVEVVETCEHNSRQLYKQDQSRGSSLSVSAGSS